MHGSNAGLIADYPVDIQYKPGHANVVPDTLSWVIPADETVPSVSLSTYLTADDVLSGAFWHMLLFIVT